MFEIKIPTGEVLFFENEKGLIIRIHRKGSPLHEEEIIPFSEVPKLISFLESLRAGK
jgi:hypothetical protein